MRKPKIGILKAFFLNDKGNFRYYSPLYDREKGKLKKELRPKMPILNLNDYPQIQTEKILARLIYNNYGEGKYLCFAFIKGYKGTWVFWKGEVNSDGFINTVEPATRHKSIEKLRDEYAKAEDDEEREWIKEEIEDEKEIRTSKRRGLMGYIKSSSKRRKDLILWNEEEPNEEFDEWQTQNTVDNKEEKFDDWGKGEEKEEFEKW
jgi:hypothetical protein